MHHKSLRRLAKGIINTTWTLNEQRLGTQWTKLGHRLNILRALSARSTGTECPIYMLLLGQYNCDFYWFYFCSCFSKKKYKNGYFMILLWDFHDTSCKFIRKVSFLYITIYQVNTTLFSLRMRLWDFFPKKQLRTKMVLQSFLRLF